MDDPDQSRKETWRTSRRSIVSALAKVGVVAPLVQARASAQDNLANAGPSFQFPGGKPRSVAEKLAERASLLDFDVDPRGRNDSSAGFRRAIEQIGAGQLFVPRGIYLVENLGILGAAGIQIVGDSRWQTVFRSEAGGGPLFHSQVAGSSTSAFHLLSDFTIDLNNRGGTAIDLASVNATTVQRIHFKGGSDRTRRGIGVRFASPLQKGAYDNGLYDCTFEGLDRAVVWETGANSNSVFNCRLINCRVGYDMAPDGEIDTPKIFGGRVEGCEIGLREGARYGTYFGVRFENNAIADIVFTAHSAFAGFWGGHTATTAMVIKDLALAHSPHIDSAGLGYVQVEEDEHNPKISTGRHIFAKAGKAPPITAQNSYAAFFYDYTLMANGVAMEFATASGEGRIVGMFTNPQSELTISGLDRAANAYRPINLGGGPAVRPIRHAATDLGATGTAYKNLHLSDGVFIEGERVLASRQPNVADDRTLSANSATVNQIIAALRRHGLIG